MWWWRLRTPLVKGRDLVVGWILMGVSESNSGDFTAPPPVEMVGAAVEIAGVKSIAQTFRVTKKKAKNKRKK